MRRWRIWIAREADAWRNAKPRSWRYDLSQDFDAFYAQPLAPSQEAGDEYKILVISADGKGIVMHPNGLREATRRALEQERHKQQTRLSPGEKKNRKRMATVVSVYEVDPYPRTAGADS